jgi:predicted XRE-type DNA-binding protein
MTNLIFDKNKHYLGRLCKSSHEWEDSDKTIRLLSNKQCVLCLRNYGRDRDEQLKSQRRQEDSELESIEKRKQHINLSETCMIWDGAEANSGYGQVKTGKYRGTTAHRASLIEFTGIDPIDRNIHACHACSNKKCVNPKHLYWGTHKENQRDKVNDGASQRGSDRWNAKLTEENVLQICFLLDNTDKSQTEIASMFGIDRKSVSHIDRGIIWGWLTKRKPILERKLEAEVPENMRFAYRQLRQKGMSHQEAFTRLT